MAGKDHRYSLDDLRTIRELVAKSGLIKAYDGRNWMDLRLVMQDVIDYAVELNSVIAKLEDQISQIEKSVDSDVSEESY